MSASVEQLRQECVTKSVIPTVLEVHVSDQNKDPQLFLKACGIEKFQDFMTFVESLVIAEFERREIEEQKRSDEQANTEVCQILSGSHHFGVAFRNYYEDSGTNFRAFFNLYHTWFKELADICKNPEKYAKFCDILKHYAHGEYHIFTDRHLCVSKKNDSQTPILQEEKHFLRIIYRLGGELFDSVVNFMRSTQMIDQEEEKILGHSSVFRRSAQRAIML